VIRAVSVLLFCKVNVQGFNQEYLLVEVIGAVFTSFHGLECGNAFCRIFYVHIHAFGGSYIFSKLNIIRLPVFIMSVFRYVFCIQVETAVPPSSTS
jgi:hypothetical protein